MLHITDSNSSTLLGLISALKSLPAHSASPEAEADTNEITNKDILRVIDRAQLRSMDS